MVTKEEIFRMLEGFGIGHDGVVMMHSALRSVGKIDGGAVGLLDAMTEYLCDGLFMTPGLSCNTVNKDGDIYNPAVNVPCVGAMGAVCAEEALKRENAVRSLHPTHSLSVFGKRAKEFVRGEEKATTPAPAGGALSRLYEEGGKILLVGVGMERNTYLHAIDEELNIPYRLSKAPFYPYIEDLEGNRYAVNGFCGHYGHCWDFYPNYEAPLRELGTIQYGKLGGAQVICFDVRTSRDAIYKMWERAEYDLCNEDTPIPERYYK